MSRQIHTYIELKRQIHEDLRTQHPEWILSDGNCPECDEHESRLRELLDARGQIESTTETGQQLIVRYQTTQVRHESS